ncbi:MAG TPA: GGDEF domain-containing protein, partial [Solirubrobacteraceae bacterium]|nr:GGDEF domain-containing protein [Solirubrobacteraceae bacterium]
VDLKRRGAPFIALMLAGFVVVPLPPRDERPASLLAAGVLLAAVVIAVAAGRWERLPRWIQILPLLGCLGVVALLRDAEGGAVSAESPLALVPVFWCALYGTRRQLGVLIVGVAAVFVVPRILVGGSAYPVSEWERALIWPLTGLIIGVTVQELVARIKRQAEQLQELASTDALTGVANRRTWDSTLAREVDRAKRSNEPLVVGLLDLNDFKRFNDLHGHPAADRFLKEMTSAWGSALRSTDLLARLGGDEFGLLLPGLTAIEAEAVLRRLEELMPAEQSFAFGLVQTDGTEPVEALLTRADESLYRSKAERTSVIQP